LLSWGPVESKIVAKYEYTDETETVLYQSVRYEPKAFKQRRPDGKDGWIWNLEGVRRVLYNLPGILEAESILFVEGEKDVESAKTLGLPATTSGGTGTWRSEFAQCLRGKAVAVIADADQPGRKHARKVASALTGVAASVKYLELPDANDLTEWIENGGTREKLLELIDSGPLFTGTDAEQCGNQEATKPVGVLLSDVEPEEVQWLWKHRIPLGKITILDGDPGLGKSTLALEIAARLSRGAALPTAEQAVEGGTVLLTAEDGLPETVAPRLIAADADTSKVVAIKYTPDHEGEKTVSSIPFDIPTIEAAIERVRAKLVIVDVLMAYLPSQTNTYRDQDIRLALAPLAQMANKVGVAVLCIRHLTKAPGGNPLYRGGGSIGIISVARAGFLLARDPDDEALLVLAQTKSNLGPPMPSLCYRLESSEGVARIVWQGESPHTAASLLAATVESEEERGALADAREFLQQELSIGPVKQVDVSAEARSEGIKEATLRRAKKSLGVVAEKKGAGKNSYWQWRLPGLFESSKAAHTRSVNTFSETSPSRSELTLLNTATSPEVVKDAHSEGARDSVSALEELI